MREIFVQVIVEGYRGAPMVLAGIEGDCLASVLLNEGLPCPESAYYTDLDISFDGATFRITDDEVIRVINASYTPPPQPTIKETYDMKAPIIETPTLYRGRDVAKLSTEELMAAIRDLNRETKELTDLGVQSEAVNKRIADIKAATTVIVAQLDASV
jgi:hypothetical protein